MSSTRIASVFFFALLFFVSNQTLAQNRNQTPKGNSTISGHVSIEGKDAVNVSVVLKKGGNDYSDDWGKVVTKTKTDDKGNFQLTGIPAGSYNLSPELSGYVLTNAQERLFFYGAVGKSLTIKDGENLKSLDFNMIRGGVITGRVTDREGKPIISQKVALWQVDEKGQREPIRGVNYWMGDTDDRGVYRYYGLKPGRYLVSAGVDPSLGQNNWNRKTFYPLTFYPNTRNKDEATIIEIEAGSEINEIDIRLGQRAVSYEVSGRIINEETNQPVQGAYIGLTPIKEDKKDNTFSFSGGERSNNKGEFKINGIVSGKYKVGIIFQQKNSLNSPPVTVEVTDSDVKDVVIKANRGLSVSGTVTFENMSTVPQSVKMENLNISAYIVAQEGLPTESTAEVAADGSFTLGGLREGKVNFYIRGLEKGFHIFRLERGGVPQKDGIIELGNESIQGIRVHVVYGNCILRGEVRTEGTMPADSVIMVRLRRTDGAQVSSNAMPDALGRFLFDGLPPGEYEVTAAVYDKSVFTRPSMSESKPLLSGKQTVTVSNGVEANVSLTVNAGGGTQQ